ncbi:class I adenylate-forming enzyme family protein [Streptomyces sp. NPDC047002]|uniref:class I adenylate-forming enzyme family protein n=1 Tax=Streptomyces sp. NPDC047002 TaxID=3155475 RepID=UPI003452C236
MSTTAPPLPGGEADDLASELAAAFERHARHGRVALLDDGETLTYGDLGCRVERAAAGLRALAPEGAVTFGLLAGKGIPLAVAVLGALRAGHCVCVLDPRLSPQAAAGRAAEFGIGRLLADAAHFPGAPPAAGPPWDLLDTVLAEGREAPAPRPTAEPEAPALLLFTSGSTGAPKGIRLTRRNLCANARGVAEHTGLTPSDRLLHLMPMHHTNGVNNQLLAPLLAGASVAFVPRFRAAEVEEQIRRFEPSVLTGVPTMYLRMLPHLRPGAARAALRMLRCGSAPLTEAQHDQIEAAFGVPLVQSYGLSEATCTTAMNPPHAIRRGTVGTVLPGQEVRLLSPATGRDVPTGAEGEICIGGPTVMTGYVGDAGPEGPVRDGLLHTGDLGTLDADGYLTVTGRLKDVIIRGGENLAPRDIETALTEHPGITEAAVVGAPHHDLGEVPVAYVVCPGPGAPAAQVLREHVMRRLTRIHAPESVEYLEALPVNGVGKIDKKALRERAARRGADAGPPAHT